MSGLEVPEDFMEKVGTLAEHFDRVTRSICPYASSTAIYKSSPDSNSRQEERQRSLLADLNEFLDPATKSRVLVYIFPEDYGDYDVAHEEAKSLWRDIEVAATKRFTEHESLSALTAQHDNIFALYHRPEHRVIGGGLAQIRPRANLGVSNILIMTAFGNFYDSRDPRYSPHSALVVLHNADLQRVLSSRPEVAASILTQSKMRCCLSMLDPDFACDVEGFIPEFTFWYEHLFKAWVDFFFNRDSYLEFDEFFLQKFSGEISQRFGSRADINCHIAKMEDQIKQIMEGIFTRMDLPMLQEIMRAHPKMRYVDLLQGLYGHHESLLPKPLPQFKMEI